MTQHALTTSRESPRSAGLTLRSPYGATVPAEGREVIRTDLQIKLPDGCYGRIAPIIYLVTFHRISIGAMVNDAGFRGNNSDDTFCYRNQQNIKPNIVFCLSEQKRNDF